MPRMLVLRDSRVLDLSFSFNFFAIGQQPPPSRWDRFSPRITLHEPRARFCYFLLRLPRLSSTLWTPRASVLPVRPCRSASIDLPSAPNAPHNRSPRLGTTPLCPLCPSMSNGPSVPPVPHSRTPPCVLLLLLLLLLPLPRSPPLPPIPSRTKIKYLDSSHWLSFICSNLSKILLGLALQVAKTVVHISQYASALQNNTHSVFKKCANYFIIKITRWCSNRARV